VASIATIVSTEPPLPGHQHVINTENNCEFSPAASCRRRRSQLLSSGLRARSASSSICRLGAKMKIDTPAGILSFIVRTLPVEFEHQVITLGGRAVPVANVRTVIIPKTFRVLHNSHVGHAPRILRRDEK